MSLAYIQHAFHQAVYGADDARLSALILADTAFPTHQRIGVYRNNTLGTLKEVIKSTYPVCQQLVGERYFDQLAKHFVSQKPSSHSNLDLYGADFADCLIDLIQQRPELAELAYLPDVARLEWALHVSYYARNRTNFDFAGFAALSPEDQAGASFALAADIFLLDSAYPAYSIWQQHQSGPPALHKFATDQDMGFTLVVRDKFKPIPVPVSVDLYALLQAIQQPSNLAGMESLLAKSPVSLQALIQQGWVVSYKVGEPC